MNENRQRRTRRPSISDDDAAETEVISRKKPQRRPSIGEEPDEHSDFCENRTRRRLSISDNEEERCDKAVTSKRRPSLDNIDIDLTVEDTTDEIQYLKSQGILPKDFPSVITGDDEKYDDADLAEEIKVLLAKGVITDEDAELMRRNWQSSLKSTGLLDCRSCKIKIPSFDINGIPVNWTNCDKNSKIHKLVKLKPGLDIYDLIEQEFCKVNIRIKKIERLENVRQLRRFRSESEEIQNHRLPGFDLNIQYLYHGTDVEKERICEEGLDQRLSRMGYFGKGIYFSDNPLKCVHYSEECSSPNEAYILMCRVILGTAKVYPAGCYDTTLKREPEKTDQSDGWRYYDSVMGCPKDFNEYVVYENRRAMIEYIITFTIDVHLANQIRERSCYVSSKGKVKDSCKRKCSGEDDHFQKISEVRETVRRKRMQEKGISYSEPSKHQQEQDEEMWHQLQTLRLNQAETIATDSQVPNEPVVFSDFHGDSCYGSSSPPRSPDACKAEITCFAYENEASGSDVEATGSDVTEINPVDQVLSSCMAEFMAVTDCEDSCIARHYVQKALQDVNLAITFYYEDM